MGIIKRPFYGRFVASLDITPAIKHNHYFATMPVFTADRYPEWLYLFAGVISSFLVLVS